MTLGKPRSQFRKALSSIVLCTVAVGLIVFGTMLIITRAEFDEYVSSQCERSSILSPYTVADAKKRGVYPRNRAEVPHDVQAYAEASIPTDCP